MIAYLRRLGIEQGVPMTDAPVKTSALEGR
jgi:hypothetical protein